MEAFFTHLWKSAIIITIFYGFYKLILQKETFFQSIRHFLLFGIVTACILPFIFITKYITIEPVSSILIDTTINNNVLDSETSTNWLLIFTYLYTTITLILLVKFIFQLTSIVTLIYRNSHIKIDTNYIIEIDSQTSPFSFFNFIFYNPIQFKKEELEQIIAHEKAHAIQKHSIDTILSNLLTVFLWFNPFAWFYKQNIEQNLEFIADDYAQKAVESKSAYQQLLLKITIPNPQSALVNNFYNSLIKKRIIMLQKTKSKKINQLKLIIIVPLLALFILNFNTKVIAQKNDSKPTKNAWSISDGITSTSVGIIIDKNTSNSKLENLKSSFKDSYDIAVTYTVKRNSKNEIVNIKITLINKYRSIESTQNENRPIKPFEILYDTESKVMSTKNIKKVSPLKNIKIDQIINNNDKNPLIILDGIILKNQQMEDVDPNTIESINVLKGMAAKSTYGEKGKHGVILITSKKNIVKKVSMSFLNNGAKEPLIILNGNEITKKEIEALDSNSQLKNMEKKPQMEL